MAAVAGEGPEWAWCAAVIKVRYGSAPAHAQTWFGTCSDVALHLHMLGRGSAPVHARTWFGTCTCPLWFGTCTCADMALHLKCAVWSCT